MNSPEKPVYKLEGKDYYIYFNPGKIGWRIGKEINLSGENEGQFLFKSEFFIVFIIKALK